MSRHLQVDSVDIQGFTNQQAVEVLRHTGHTVHLKLIRRGFKPEDLPPALAPSIGVLPPHTTIPTTTIVLEELELERRKAEEEAAAQGRDLMKRDKNTLLEKKGHLMCEHVWLRQEI